MLLRSQGGASCIYLVTMDWSDEPIDTTLDPLPRLARLALPDPLRLTILDEDREFADGLAALAGSLDWRVRRLEARVSLWGLSRSKPHILLVDVKTLGGDWWEWVARVLEGLPDLGVVVCTGRSSLEERVKALRMGVEDWLAKPCDPTEVIARVRSVARGRLRIESQLAREPLTAGELTISPGHRQAYAHGASARLTGREFSLLHLLARQQSEVVERAEVYAQVWGQPMVKRDRSVDVHVRRIRGKLKRVSPRWSYIHTHYRVGYRFLPTREGSPAEPVMVPLLG